MGGSATGIAADHGLVLLRCLEPANRLYPNLHGETLSRLRDGFCPEAVWPWGDLDGEEVLRLLWGRFAANGGRSGPAESPARAGGAR